MKKILAVDMAVGCDCVFRGDDMDKIMDGIQIDIFAVKDGKKYFLKTIDMKDVSNILVDNLMNGIEEICSF